MSRAHMSRTSTTPNLEAMCIIGRVEVSPPSCTTGTRAIYNVYTCTYRLYSAWHCWLVLDGGLNLQLLFQTEPLVFMFSCLQSHLNREGKVFWGACMRACMRACVRVCVCVLSSLAPGSPSRASNYCELFVLRSLFAIIFHEQRRAWRRFKPNNLTWNCTVAVHIHV